MEHEEIFNLMMEVLEEDPGPNTSSELQRHLQGCPSCDQEWQRLQAVHQLFLKAPLISPAAGFTQRTLARLPNTARRLWLVGAIYAMLFVGGLLPPALAAWILLQFGPALNRPALLRSLQHSGTQLLNLVEATASAFWQGLGNIGQLVGEVVGQEPAALGWLFVMVGVIFLWGSVYNQLTRPITLSRN